jgi:hypothetical protein
MCSLLAAWTIFCFGKSAVTFLQDFSYVFVILKRGLYIAYLHVRSVRDMWFFTFRTDRTSEVLFIHCVIVFNLYKYIFFKFTPLLNCVQES